MFNSEFSRLYFRRPSLYRSRTASLLCYWVSLLVCIVSDEWMLNVWDGEDVGDVVPSTSLGYLHAAALTTRSCNLLLCHFCAYNEKVQDLMFVHHLFNCAG